MQVGVHVAIPWGGHVIFTQVQRMQSLGIIVNCHLVSFHDECFFHVGVKFHGSC